MSDELRVEDFFSFGGDGVTLSEYGNNGTRKILEKYSGGQIKEISGVSRSALANYVTGANRISKRGQEALKRLILKFNNELVGIDNTDQKTIPQNINLFTDRELLEELKNRGFNVFVSI